MSPNPQDLLVEPEDQTDTWTILAPVVQRRKPSVSQHTHPATQPYLYGVAQGEK